MDDDAGTATGNQGRSRKSVSGTQEKHVRRSQNPGKGEHVQAINEEVLKQVGAQGEHAMVQMCQVQSNHGTVRPNHGLEVVIQGQMRHHYRIDSGALYDGRLQVHGDKLFTALGGLGSLAKMMLPLKIKLTFSDAPGENESENSDEETQKNREEGAVIGDRAVGGEERETPGFRKVNGRRNRKNRYRGGRNRLKSENVNVQFVLGARQLSCQRLLNELDNLVRAGDPEFALEVRFDTKPYRNNYPTFQHRKKRTQLVCIIPARPSYIRQSLDSTKPLQLFVPSPPLRRRTSSILVGMLRWWFWPLCFLGVSWMLLLNHSTRTLLPDLLMTSSSNVTLTQALSPHPKNMAQAFILGRLRERLLVAANQTEDAIKVVLSEAEKVVGRSVSQSQLEQMHMFIQEIDERRGLVTRVSGMFTFVNIMWFMAVVGIAVSVGPSIYHILKPLRDLMRRMIKWVMDQIVIPTVRRLHDWGIFEAMAYMGCSVLLQQAYLRADMFTDASVFIAATGVALSVPCFGYSTFLHGNKIDTEPNSDRLSTMTQTWIALCSIPCAVAFESELFGYLVTFAFFGAIGFGVFIGPLCWGFGFDSGSTTERICATSFVLIHLSLAVQCMLSSGLLQSSSSSSSSLSSSSSFSPAVLSVPFDVEKVFDPFRAPVQIVGNIMYV